MDPSDIDDCLDDTQGAGASATAYATERNGMRAAARKLFKWGIVLLLAAIAAATVAILVVLSRASVETTAHGAPTRLRLHLPGGRDIAVPVYVASGRQVRIPGFLDGPIVRRGTDGN